MKSVFFIILWSFLFIQNVNAASDPRLLPNNKVGINSLSPEAEFQEVAQLVNSNGDWGWIILVVGSGDRNLEKWQKVFHSLNSKHLNPIIRISTTVDENGNWQRPEDKDAKEWAQFLNELKWPTKNRYVQIYNEVNRSTEWGGKVDAAGYALELEKTINELKLKSADFFVLNAPLDLALATSSNSLEAGTFFQTMESAVPGIFDKVDGWASHSYPNPDFSASPLESGRTGIDGYKWELSRIHQYTDHELPVFITETGWRRQGNTVSNSEAAISQNYKIAFDQVWNDGQVVVVAPFVFNYTEKLFEEFSFKRDGICLEYCRKIQDMPKVTGTPIRENLGVISLLDHAKIAIVNSPVKVNVEVKNIGNYIWSTNDLKVSTDSTDVILDTLSWTEPTIFPGQTAYGTVEAKAVKQAVLPFSFQIVGQNGLAVEKESLLQGETLISLVTMGLKTIIGKS